MPRKPRVSIPGVPEHVIQRGNNRQAIFVDDSDMKAYVIWLKEYANQYDVAIHAWVFMTNHVHLLCTPENQSAVSLMMQALGRRYVQYFNRRHSRSGTLWEGRFRSCLVQAEDYLLTLYRYIELNPVRAGMVSDPAKYSWSSYQCNGLGKKSSLLTPHPLYESLGKTNEARQANYRDLLKSSVDKKSLNNIRQTANSGLVLGSDRFVEEVETKTGTQLHECKRGRPVGWCKMAKSS
jgi:putative transposase